MNGTPTLPTIVQDNVERHQYFVPIGLASQPRFSNDVMIRNPELTQNTFDNIDHQMPREDSCSYMFKDYNVLLAENDENTRQLFKNNPIASGFPTRRASRMLHFRDHSLTQNLFKNGRAALFPDSSILRYPEQLESVSVVDDLDTKPAKAAQLMHPPDFSQINRDGANHSYQNTFLINAPKHH